MSSVARKEVLRQLPSWAIRDRYHNATTDAERLLYREEFNSRRLEGLNSMEKGDAFRVDSVGEWICRAPEIVIEQAAAHGGLLPRDGRHNLISLPVTITGDEARRQATAAAAEDADPVPVMRSRLVAIEVPEFIAIGYEIMAKRKGLTLAEYIADLYDCGNAAEDLDKLPADVLLEIEEAHPGLIEAATFYEGKACLWPELVRRRVKEKGENAEAAE